MTRLKRSYATGLRHDVAREVYESGRGLWKLLLHSSLICIVVKSRKIRSTEVLPFPASATDGGIR